MFPRITDVTAMDTLDTALLTLPEITQVVESIESPAGRFSAVQEVNSLISGWMDTSSYFAHTVYVLGVNVIEVGVDVAHIKGCSS